VAALWQGEISAVFSTAAGSEMPLQCCDAVREMLKRLLVASRENEA
jgi:hypothetical protein